MATDDEQWVLIGTSHLFLNGAYNLIEMPSDVTPIIDKVGKPKGMLRYSIEPIIYSKHGKQENLSEYYSMEECEGKEIGIGINIEGANNLPHQHTYKTKCTYTFPFQIEKKQSPIAYNTKDPNFNSSEVHRFKVDGSFKKELENEVIPVEVWGMQIPDNYSLKPQGITQVEEAKKISSRRESTGSEHKYGRRAHRSDWECDRRIDDCRG